MDLPIGPLPTVRSDNYLMEDKTANGDALYAYVDSDWGSDSMHRKSITGVVVMYAGGPGG